MTPEQASQAVRDGARVRLKYATGRGTHAEGTITGYSLVPCVFIHTDDGKEIAWRHDLAEVVD